MGRIFSNYNELDEEDNVIIDESHKKEICENLTDDKLDLLKKELDELDTKNQKRLENYQKRNKRYKELLNEYFIKNPKISLFLVFLEGSI